MTYAWWQRGTIYQIYPRSFMDANGDGVGDLAGITSKLDYLEWLGVDAIWLSPIFPSPMADFGYDVADYTGIDPLFGSLADLDALLDQAHARGLRVILDLVPNHTSDQHPWFLQARSSRDNPKRDWYLWHDGDAAGGPPNNWLSVFGGSAWEWDETTRQFYYHAFLKAQPDLNWRNPAVRTAIYDAMRFWLDKGIDGFRVDVLWHLIKDRKLRNNPPNPAWHAGESPYRSLLPAYTTDQPEVMEIVYELRAVMDEYADRVLLGEIYLPLQRLVAYYGDGGRGAHLPYNFQLITLPWDARQIAATISDYEALLPVGAWPNWVLGNHDKSRIASRVGLAQARVAAVLLFTLRGTPTLYYGDELGMQDGSVPADLQQDPQGKNMPGLGLSRDPERTPMQWSAGAAAGFTTGQPWLPVANDFPLVNVERERDDPTSMLSLHRQLLALRRHEPALSVGSTATVAAPEGVIAYVREAAGRRLLAALNLTHEPVDVPLGSLVGGSIVLSTKPEREQLTVNGWLRLDGDEAALVWLGPPEQGIVRRLAQLIGKTELARVLLIAAHPDDDVASAGGLLLELGARAYVAYVTNGSPADASWAERAGFSGRDALAQARRREAVAALALAGIPESSTRSLGIVDQTVAHTLVAATAALQAIMLELEPDAVITHPYEGGHPDHDATALAVHAAARRAGSELGAPLPVIEFTSYHAYGTGHRVGEFLPASGGVELTLELSAAQQRDKARMLELHASQTAILADFGFGVTREKFRLAPAYDFAKLAHDPLLYERFCPGMSADAWRACTLPVLEALGLTPPRAPARP